MEKRVKAAVRGAAAKAAVAPAAEWELVLSELDELDDIRAYDAAQPHADDRGWRVGKMILP